MTRFLRSPLAGILALALAMRLAGLFWGLPAADGWDDDGFAPRNFLTALALTYKPGAFFTYPPLHAFVLAILSLPAALVALWHAHSFSQADIVGEFTKPQYMTVFAVVARLVNIILSLGLIAITGRMAQMLAGKRAGLLAAGALTLNMAFTYYGQVSNLEVPYLFWSALSLLLMMEGMTRQQTRLFFWAALAAAAAVTTKDQAYAVFALTLPLSIGLWLARDAWPRRNLTSLALYAVMAIAAILLVDGAVTNSGGFMRRIAFLTGPASGDYAAYTHDMTGRARLLADMTLSFTSGVSALATLLAVLGLCRAVRGGRVWALVPAFAILSFTIAFNMVALRMDARFLLPQAIFACVYIGIAADWMLGASRSRVAPVALALLGLLSLIPGMAVGAAMVRDPRYDAERWLAKHAVGKSVETYGQNAYLPRFPAGITVWRVGDGPLNVRNPLPGVQELRAPFGEARDPDFIVVSNWWARHYITPEPSGAGLKPPIRFQVQYDDAPARTYFMALYAGKAGYHLAHSAQPVQGAWPLVHIHESLNETVDIFARD